MRFIYEGIRKGFSQGHMTGSYIILKQTNKKKVIKVNVWQNNIKNERDLAVDNKIAADISWKQKHKLFQFSCLNKSFITYSEVNYHVFKIIDENIKCTVSFVNEHVLYFVGLNWNLLIFALLRQICSLQRIPPPPPNMNYKSNNLKNNKCTRCANHKDIQEK